MSTELVLRGFFSVVLGLILSWVIYSRQDEETVAYPENTNKQRYYPFISGSLLPFCFLCYIVLGLLLEGRRTTEWMTMTLCFDVLVHTSIFFCILMPLLPWLRKHISARGCATLWMVPNYLYYGYMSYMTRPEPHFVIHVPGELIQIILLVWGSGFVIVLGWHIISHIRFRAQILDGSKTITDPDILQVWVTELERARCNKPNFRLLTSPHVKTPLTVGLFRKKLCVILPERTYSRDELELIFRHEIIHICREDSWNKFFLVFCTAISWFNPLMWTAMRKSSEDLELSCDETVLLDADEDTRGRYASLLLSTAGDDRGFSTCLSASASSLRYRLKNIVKPRKRTSGALIIGLTLCIMLMSVGSTALAFGGCSGKEVIFRNQSHDAFTLRSQYLADKIFNVNYECTDESAFFDYLSSLELAELSGNFSFSEGRQSTYILDTPQGSLGLTLMDDYLRLSPLYDHDSVPMNYYIPGGTDWEYLDSIFLTCPAMEVKLTGRGEPYGHNVTGRVITVTDLSGGKQEVLYHADYPPEDQHGIFGYLACDTATFSFSMDTVSDLTIVVENWERTFSETIILDPGEKLSLTIYPAHYTVTGTFINERGRIFEAEFDFDIGQSH